MSEKKGPDWSKRKTVNGMAEWIGKNSGAIVVMVVRGGEEPDTVFWIDPLCKPEDGAVLVEALLPEMVAQTNFEREEAKREKALKAAKKKVLGGVFSE